MVVSKWPVPQAAYVHVPFCRHHCGYCNFSVLAGHDHRAEDFLLALQRELKSLQEPRSVATLFIGGGTPTHLSVAWLEKFVAIVQHWFPLQPGGEFSIEANPSDITPQLVSSLKSLGVNRVSLGAQSFAAGHLKTLERDHSAETIATAVELLAGSIPNVSIDLIFGVPGQSIEDWHRDLQQATALPIKHLSAYGLTYEKGARFWGERQRGMLQAVEEDVELEMYLAARQHLRDAGWVHYEVSNYAQAGFQCRHNQAYWEGRGWYAAGPGAARFVDGRREVNHRSPTKYIARLLAGETATAESEEISDETWARERLVFGLRQLAGVSLKTIHQETGVDIEGLCAATMHKLVELGMLEKQGDNVRVTERGLVVSDSIFAELL